MPLFLMLLITLLAGDAFWWWHADRLLRPLPGDFWWRLVLGLFMGGQIALVLWILGGRLLADYLPARPPQALMAAAYLWHLLVLPTVWAVVGTTSLLLGMGRIGRG